MSATTLIVATSTCGLDTHPQPHAVRMLRLHLLLEGTDYLDGKDIQAADFYRWMLAHPNQIATTSPPTQNELLTFFQGIVREGYQQVLVLTLSAKLSKTYERVQQMAKVFASRLDIRVFDTQNLSHAEAVFALEAERCLQNGWPIDRIIRRLELLRTHVTQFITVGTLDYLIKSGRLSPTGGMLANWIQLRPVLQVVDGEIRPVARVRKTGRAMQTIVDSAMEYVGNARSDLVVMEAGVLEVNQAFRHMLHDRYHFQQLPRRPLSPVISAHTGPEGVGLLVVRRPPSLQHYGLHLQADE